MPSPWPDLTVNYAHAWTEIRKGIDSNGPFYKVQYYIDQPWSVADTVVNELLGYARKSGQSIYQQCPHQYPLDPSGRSLCCQADVVGVGAPNLNSDGYPSYQSGFFVDAIYKVPGIPMYAAQDPENLMGIDPSTPLLFATQDVDFSTDVIILDNTAYTYASDSKVSKTPVKKEVGITVLDMTFYRVPYMPTPLFRSLRNRVNSSSFMGAPAGSVLFKGARTHKEINGDGSYVQSVQLIFHERDQLWNKVFRPDTLAWDTLQDGGGAGPYTSGNLSQLLALGQSYAVTS
jgi:hypothetical protein